MLARSDNGKEGGDMTRTIAISQWRLDVEDNGDRGTSKASDRDSGWRLMADLRRVVAAGVREVMVAGGGNQTTPAT